MSEAKHTPGPWLIAESVVSRHAITNMRRIRSKNEGLEHGAVCDVYGIQDGSEASANAILIAAAPDLLELLEQAVSIMKNCEVSSGICMCGDSMDGHQGQFESGHVPVDSGEYYKDCFLQKAIAAIAKATGGAA